MGSLLLLRGLLRRGSGVAYRLPCPGNPVVDGLGEGKPHNQLNGVTFAAGRCLQTVDMNQEAYFEQALLLPHALSLLLPRLGRWRRGKTSSKSSKALAPLRSR